MNFLIFLRHSNKTSIHWHRRRRRWRREIGESLGSIDGGSKGIGSPLRNKGMNKRLERLLGLLLLSCLLLLFSLGSSFSEASKKSLTRGHWLLLLFLLRWRLLLLLLLDRSNRNMDLGRSHKMVWPKGGHIGRLNLGDSVDNHRAFVCGKREWFCQRIKERFW